MQIIGECEKARNDFELRKRGNNKKACKLQSGKAVSYTEITGRNDLSGRKLTCLKNSILQLKNYFPCCAFNGMISLRYTWTRHTPLKMIAKASAIGKANHTV